MRIKVRDHEGDDHQLDVEYPTTLMEALRDNGLPVAAECSGNCACATCHVYVGAAWIDRIPPRGATEEAMLEIASEPQSNSRLSCQIVLDPSLDGLSVELAPGSDR